MKSKVANTTGEALKKTAIEPEVTPTVITRALKLILREHIQGTREALFYLARNIDVSFDGKLGHVEANAHASLTKAFGKLLDMEEWIGWLPEKEDLSKEVA